MCVLLLLLLRRCRIGTAGLTSYTKGAKEKRGPLSSQSAVSHFWFLVEAGDRQTRDIRCALRMLC